MLQSEADFHVVHLHTRLHNIRNSYCSFVCFICSRWYRNMSTMSFQLWSMCIKKY